MTDFLRKLTAGLDAWLFRRGFTVRDVRALMRAQIYVSVAASLAVLAITGFGLWGLAFSAAAFLVGINFWSLAKFGQGVVFVRRGALVSLLLRFYLRLALTGIGLFALVALAHAPAAALLSGMSTAVAAMLWWGAWRTMRTQVKEA